MSGIKIVSIEGNIGGGKSTLLEALKNVKWVDKKIVFVREPVDEWEKIKDSEGKTILEKFYNDQEKYSFPFQMLAFISRLKLLKESIELNPGCIIITERSLFTDKLVFAKMLFDSKKMEDINYLIYLNWFDTFSEKYSVNKIIYVKTNSEVCFERIEKRSRQGENNIPLEYLMKCNIYHEKMIHELNIDTLILDGNIDIYNNKEKLDEWINSIREFII
jgi:deoxyadenosine/deoxycytidine kinase